MARAPLGARVFSLLLLFSLLVVAGVGGPADLFLFYLLQSAGAVVYCVLNLERIER
jgi:hypothetical protein